eukprot:SAG11_NODE_1714_length_4398_cov_2.677832_3_plen_63_part_00
MAQVSNNAYLDVRNLFESGAGLSIQAGVGAIVDPIRRRHLQKNVGMDTSKSWASEDGGAFRP